MLIAGCSSGSGSAGDRDAFISQVCDLYMPCCSKAGKPSDGSQCRAFYGAFASSASYDAGAANLCLTELKASSASPTFCEDGMDNSKVPSCDKVFSGSSSGGTKKPGETCSQDSECAPSTEGKVDCRTLFKDGGTIKKCQIQITGKAGDTPCLGTVDGNLTSYNTSGTETDVLPRGYLCNVKDGLRCDSTTNKCVAISKIGEACAGFGSNLCTKDAYCDSTTKQCAARKPVGSACTSFSSEQCADGTYCDSASKTCKASLAVGAACTSSSECISKSCVNKVCDKTGGTDLTTAFLCGG